MSEPVPDPLRDPVVDPVVVEAVVEIRNRFGVGGLRDLARLAGAEAVAAERAMAELDPGSWASPGPGGGGTVRE
ncbi:MAG: hypothetical protein ACFCVG_09070 [Kineosporiaceae bacterium]